MGFVVKTDKASAIFQFKAHKHLFAALFSIHIPLSFQLLATHRPLKWRTRAGSVVYLLKCANFAFIVAITMRFWYMGLQVFRRISMKLYG